MASSMLILSVKHHTSKPLTKDPYVGSSEIVLDRLLQMCENNQRRSIIVLGFSRNADYHVQMPFWNCDRKTAKRATREKGS
jgi:hypothetical protein